MKVGDKLLCKKLYNDLFIIGKEYSIYSIIKKYDEVIMLSERYDISFTISTKGTHYLWDYFYKSGEIRNNKLKTILNKI